MFPARVHVHGMHRSGINILFVNILGEAFKLIKTRFSLGKLARLSRLKKMPKVHQSFGLCCGKNERLDQTVEGMEWRLFYLTI